MAGLREHGGVSSMLCEVLLAVPASLSVAQWASVSMRPTMMAYLPTLLHTLQACVVAHSYGTFIGSRLVQARRERVASLALIDPVCFGGCTGGSVGGSVGWPYWVCVVNVQQQLGRAAFW